MSLLYVCMYVYLTYRFCVDFDKWREAFSFFFSFLLFKFLFPRHFFLAKELRGEVNCSIIEMLSCLFRAGSPYSV